MTLPTFTDSDIYRGDTIIVTAPIPTSITYTSVAAQMRVTEDATDYYEAESIVADVPNGEVDVTFSAANASLLDASKTYVMDVQYMDVAGVVVTTEKYTFTITKDVTRVFGTKVNVTTDVANFAALPAIGSAVVGTIYKTLDDDALYVKANSSATDYSDYY